MAVLQFFGHICTFQGTVKAWIFGMVWGGIIWVDLLKRLKCKKWLKVGLLYKRFIFGRNLLSITNNFTKLQELCLKHWKNMRCIQKTTSPLTPHSHPTCPSSHRSYGHHLHVEVSRHTAQVEHKLSWWFPHRPGDQLQQERSSSHEETCCLVAWGLKTRDTNRLHNDNLNPLSLNFISHQNHLELFSWEIHLYLYHSMEQLHKFKPFSTPEIHHFKARKPKLLPSFGTFFVDPPKDLSPKVPQSSYVTWRCHGNSKTCHGMTGTTPENQPLAPAGGDVDDMEVAKGGI